MAYTATLICRKQCGCYSVVSGIASPSSVTSWDLGSGRRHWVLSSSETELSASDGFNLLDKIKPRRSVQLMDCVSFGPVSELTELTELQLQWIVWLIHWFNSLEHHTRVYISWHGKSWSWLKDRSSVDIRIFAGTQQYWLKLLFL